MKIYKITVIVLSVIIGISVALFLNLTSPVTIPAYTNSITEEDYQVLKNYALEVANNSDIGLNNKDIEVTIELDDETLKMDINKDIYGIKAIFPISNLAWKTEDGIMKYNMVIDYDNVIFSEHTDVKPAFFYMLISIFLAGLLALPIYFLLYSIPSSIILKMTKKKFLTNKTPS